MPNVEIDLNPVDFVTVGTIGPKGKRVFHLQAGKDEQIVSLFIEKEQACALSEAVKELIDDLDERSADLPEASVDNLDMELREPIEPIFRVGQIGLGHDEDKDMVVLVVQELTIEDEIDNPSVVRMWCTRQQMRALSQHTMSVVRSGRADPKQNGRLVYYWT